MKRQPLPESISRLTTYLQNISDPTGPTSALLGISTSFCHLRSLIDDEDSRELLEMALREEEVVSSWLANIPSDISAKRLPLSTEFYYNPAGYVEYYQNLHVANLVLRGQSIQMLIHNIIQQSIAALFLETQPDEPYLQDQFAASVLVQQQLVQEICASTSYYLSIHIRNGSADSTRSRMSDHTISPLQAPHTTTIPSTIGTMLLWPLFIAGERPATPTATRAWIIDLLTMIAQDMGIRQAWTLAHILRDLQETLGETDQPAKHSPVGSGSGECDGEDEVKAIAREYRLGNEV